MNKSGLYKGCLEPIILRLLNEKKRMYGYEITQLVKEITKGELTITEGALYPLLHRLEADGVLITDTEKVENRVRKYYSLTKKGKTAEGQSLLALQDFMQAINRIMKIKTV